MVCNFYSESFTFSFYFIILRIPRTTHQVFLDVSTFRNRNIWYVCVYVCICEHMKIINTKCDVKNLHILIFNEEFLLFNDTFICLMLNGVSKKMCEELIINEWEFYFYSCYYISLDMFLLIHILMRFLLSYEIFNYVLGNLLESEHTKKWILLNSCHPICYLIQKIP